MTTTPQEAAALFDLPPPADAAESEEPADASAEAALAAELASELASTIDSGGVATDAPDSRTDRRVKVSWPARMELPDGRVIEICVRDVSEGGVGMLSDTPIPAQTVVNFEMVVPLHEDCGEAALVKGTLKTTYTVAQGSEVICGGTWQGPPAGLEALNASIKRLFMGVTERPT